MKTGMFLTYLLSIFWGHQAQAVVGGQDVLLQDPVAKTSVVLFTATGQPFCSGAIVDNQHVLTAAHCVQGAAKVYVGYGTKLSSQTIMNLTYNKVETIIVHPDFQRNFSDTPQSTVGDVALLKLDRPHPKGFEAAPIFGQGLNKGDQLTLAAFGSNSQTQDVGKGTLRKTNFNFEDSWLRAREISFYASKKTCPAGGDSGGAFYYFEGGKKYLLGILSRGLMNSTVPCSGHGFMTDLRTYQAWIQANL